MIDADHRDRSGGATAPRPRTERYGTTDAAAGDVLRDVPAILGSTALRRALHGAAGPGAAPGNDLDRIVAEAGDVPVRAAIAPRGAGVTLVGRVREDRMPVRVGYLDVPMPHVRWLEVGAGGVRIDDGQAAAADGPGWAAVRRLAREDAIDCVFLAGVPVHLALVAPRGWRIVEGPRRPRRRARFVRDDGTRGLPIGGKARRKRRQRATRLAREAGTLDLEVCERPGRVARFLACADAVTRRSWHDGLGVGVRDDDAWRRRALSSALSGRLRAYVLRAGDRPVGYVFGTVHPGREGTVFFHEATAIDRGFERLAPGSVMLWLVMEDLLAAGVDAVDFGHGDSAYKRDWANEARDERHVRLWTDRPRARLGARLDRAAVRAHALGTNAAARVGGLERLRGAWRRRLRRGDSSGGTA